MLFFADEGRASFLRIAHGELGADLVCPSFACMVGTIKPEDGVPVKIVAEYLRWGPITGSVSPPCFVLPTRSGDFLPITSPNREGNLALIDKDRSLEVALDTL